MDLPDISTRIVLAPMAGGVSTPQLVSAVGDAGGLGFLAAGYLSADRVRADIDAVRERSPAPYALNIFVPNQPSAARMQRAEEYGGVLGEWLGDMGSLSRPRYTDDEYDAKVELACVARPDLVSFTFGLPTTGVVTALHDASIPVAVTVTTVQEAEQAAATGVDALVVQGWEAGAHRGSFLDENDHEQPGLLPLLRLVADVTDLPLIGGGGIADGAGIAAVLAAGATAALLGTAFLRCPEAGTSPAHVAALSEGRATMMTRAFTGRRARGLDNEMIRSMGPLAPSAYPEVNHLTAQLRAEARKTGDAEHLNLWAGQAHPLARAMPAGQLVTTLARETRAAAERLASIIGEYSAGHA